MNAPVHTIILCEDLQLECFIRRFLIKQGWEGRQIRTVSIPRSGAGITWLQEKLPLELKAYRSRNSRATTCLIVGCDADQHTIEGRIRTLREAFARGPNPPARRWS